MQGVSTLSRKFITYATLVLTLILWAWMFLIYNRNLILFEESSHRELAQIKKSLENKGHVLINMVSRISAEALMSLDMYLLEIMALEVMDDNEVASIEIFDGEYRQLLIKKKDDDGFPITYYEKEIKTDKKKHSVEMISGKIRIGMSTFNYKKAEMEITKKIASLKRTMVLSFIWITTMINIFVAITMKFILKKVVIDHIVDISQRVKDIAEGEGDLTKRIRIKNEDEIGSLAKAFNQFVDNLHRMIQTITSHTSNVNASAEELATLSDKAKNTTENVSRQASSVSLTTGNTTNRINSIVKNTDDMSKSVTNVASSIEEMNASLNEVSRHCQKEFQIAAKANDQAESTQKMMQKLEESSKKICSVIELINNIADQTNLLALNATRYLKFNLKHIEIQNPRTLSSHRKTKILTRKLERPQHLFYKCLYLQRNKNWTGTINKEMFEI